MLCRQATSTGSTQRRHLAIVIVMVEHRSRPQPRCWPGPSWALKTISMTIYHMPAAKWFMKSPAGVAPTLATTIWPHSPRIGRTFYLFLRVRPMFAHFLPSYFALAGVAVAVAQFIVNKHFRQRKLLLLHASSGAHGRCMCIEQAFLYSPEQPCIECDIFYIAWWVYRYLNLSKLFRLYLHNHSTHLTESHI